VQHRKGRWVAPPVTPIILSSVPTPTWTEEQKAAWRAQWRLRENSQPAREKRRTMADFVTVTFTLEEARDVAVGGPLPDHILTALLQQLQVHER
jgi:hypothetical protein